MSDREMTYASSDKQAPHCGVCGRVKMQVGGDGPTSWQCVNCGDDKPKTGQTIVLVEEAGKPSKLQFVRDGTTPPPVSAQVTNAAPSAQPGTISVSVPIELFVELVMWSKKLKWPKRPEEAARLKAILDLQTQLQNKLQELSK